jgi:hypothetical protein
MDAREGKTRRLTGLDTLYKAPREPEKDQTKIKQRSDKDQTKIRQRSDKDQTKIRQRLDKDWRELLPALVDLNDGSLSHSGRIVSNRSDKFKQGYVYNSNADTRQAEVYIYTSKQPIPFLRFIDYFLQADSKRPQDTFTETSYQPLVSLTILASVNNQYKKEQTHLNSNSNPRL